LPKVGNSFLRKTVTITDSDSYGISLLYVEDEPDSRNMLNEILHSRYPELRIVVAHNGEAGMEAFLEHRPEIVITDINMPVANGITLATGIKAISPATEIIALTAHTETQLLLQAIEIGFSHYILKPIDINQIFSVIDKTLLMINSERQIAEQNLLIRELNSELARKAADLERANRELESFNYSVAHDLRSPIISISGFAQRLLNMHPTGTDETNKQYLEIINREADHMNNLIGSLLKFSVHSRKLVEKKWTCLSTMAHEIAATLQMQEQHSVTQFTIGDGINGYCDPELLRIVMDNLLGNAWKYSAASPRAKIEFGTEDREEDLVYFIRDNGIGFDPQQAGRLFIPFHRLECHDQFEGMGIGLATAQRIIDRHGGKIWAEGSPGNGATFFFTL
jgi:signal transduction histidine kinase